MTATTHPVAPKARKPSAKDEGSSSPAPRKRRRRAVGSGAADDCFTCATRQVRCDRRRPYCTPCLDLGRQCSGYKTTLTWGIGVASRGKLRGLSLPISGAKRVSPANGGGGGEETSPRSVPKEAAAVSEQHRPRVDAASETRPQKSETRKSEDTHEFIQTQTQTPTPTPTSPWSAINATPPPRSSTAESSSVPSTASPAYSVPQHPSYSYADAYGQQQQQQQPLYQTVHEPLKVEPTAGVGSIAFSSLASPYGSPYSSSSVSHFDGSPLEPYPLARKRSPEDDIDDSDPSRVRVRAESVSSSDMSVQQWQQAASYRPYSPHSFYLNQTFSTTWIGRNPRMRYLIGYYTEVIAPVIVTFDSPTNPFRLYLLELAKDSETLQHAIAALSLSNLRQRRKNWGLSTGKTIPSRRSLQAHCRMTDRAFEEAFGVTTPEEQLLEESYHKGMAIRSINAQLADPVQRRTDAVFATLLVLCLFHMCDTGLASFRSQFAGVKKLFIIRGAGKGNDSDVMKWFMRMFTWFDTMTATINDRDSQMNGCLLDVTTSGQDEWALENLAGCDPRLFRAVAQLGRLNQLSQAKPVDDSTPRIERPVPTVSLPQSMIHYPAHVLDTPYVDGPRPAYSLDSRTEFWSEWHAIRQKLETWRLPEIPGTHSPVPSLSSTVSSSPSITTSAPSAPTSSLFSAPLPPSPLSHVNPANLPEISNISESFRYSALLYLERLAHPSTPSNHPRFQTLVTAALHYITAVQSDVFLLWPLFVVGSECSSESDRAIIRLRCCDIQKDSGFVNNLSCLQLLERIWREEDPNVELADSAGRRVVGGAAFRWRRIIDSQHLTDEYIVV
ncbi:uncharacterized protein GIQ15_00336 [Arthroderma uncinatum]|uniref:uncharacterized protein n=1 Tax=Arthroderma uncinatum TaxID=74035 RepID=UPI00144AEC02|nr:uncharacterized protein GIQ15_00336 [Arthroderma uncinatum]KAF3490819.1 hypothetical protein GIQ15_00336 [Arthroderma uncinatum]